MWRWLLMPIWALSRKVTSPAQSECVKGSSATQQFPFKLLDRHGPAEQITLIMTTPPLLQCGPLQLCFHPFGKYGNLHSLGEQNDGLGDVGTVGIEDNIAHEALIDLQLFQW